MFILRFFYVVFSILIFVSLFILFFPIILLLSCSRDSGKKFIWRLLTIWAKIWLTIIGMPVKPIYKYRPDKKQRYVVIANHISYLDTAVLFSTVPFFVRPLAKSSLANIPLFGYLYRQIAILVDRESHKSKQQSIKKLRHIIEKESSIFIFPEGTFNETEQPLKSFYDGAFRIAIASGYPILPVLFLDTINRWHYSAFWKWSPGINRAIIMPPININDFKNSKALKEKAYQLMLEELKKNNFMENQTNSHL